MVFVPPVTYVPPQHASLEAQDLAREIEQVVVEFQKRRPRTSDRDIRQAMSIVGGRAGMARGARQGAAALVAALLGVLLALALGLFFFMRAG
jgi:hypothetical protein